MWASLFSTKSRVSPSLFLTFISYIILLHFQKPEMPKNFLMVLRRPPAYVSETNWLRETDLYGERFVEYVYEKLRVQVTVSCTACRVQNTHTHTMAIVYPDLGQHNAAAVPELHYPFLSHSEYYEELRNDQETRATTARKTLVRWRDTD